ncbi:MAG: DUF1826 domain-containing protein [Candidatus Thiodiazotropha sp. (ex Lucina pensylvanica)]|nr:DUF1826 domain-containing protein [Candidatus Thiodiazotropha taylori]MBT3059166.1 DUF1826 domain-containing protein [Candidatus Thiodiazotropha sp. (ex Lucina pensylvanica)]MBT3065173.1 DUF1826 domain-containing protein [Candidatus Thiodiazotropha sp. (ex Lucina pensylvanica)]
MTEANIVSEVITAVPTWQRVPELADLVEIFDPGVQVCTWQRESDPAIETYLSGLHQTGELQVLETLSSAAQPKLDCLPEGSGLASLIGDLSLLREVVCELMGCSEVGLRLARVGHAMCPGWHIDRTSIRLVCTYQGPGTEWLNDQNVECQDLHDSRIRAKAAVQAVTGEIVLLKGSLFQGNEAFGAVHRSPEPAPDAALRTLVTLDPLWRA